MASFRSLGVHTPAALQYLVDEGVLPPDPAPELYNWETYGSLISDKAEDEILKTDHCVVWSQGGVTKKVFRFEIEQQAVIQAVLTQFPQDDSPQVHGQPTSASKLPGQIGPILNGNGTGTLPALKWSSRSAGRTSTPSKEPKLTRALVILFKLQAHIYFLAGSSHVINLPFEIERAFPAPRGLLLQRKVARQADQPGSPVIPSAPKNSFLSSQILSQNQSQSRHSSYSIRSSRLSNSAGSSSLLPQNLLRSSRETKPDLVPRLFSLTDPLSEMGLVVTNVTEGRRGLGRLSTSTLGREPVLETLDPAEQVLYVTAASEYPTSQASNDKALIISVTVNYDRRLYTIWHAHYLGEQPVSRAAPRLAPGTKSHRMSSFGTGTVTGTTTPGIRLRDGHRESSGGTNRMRSGQASFPATTTHSRDPINTQSTEEDIASQLDPDYALGKQPARESRRVSSLLSRTDLSTNNDRSTFQDLATTRKGRNSSFNYSTNRAASFGGNNDRLSFIGSRPKQRFSSANYGTSLTMPEFSMDDSVADLSLNTADDDTEPEDEMEVDDPDTFISSEPINGLKKELVLVRMVEIPIEESVDAPIFKSFVSESEDPRAIKVFNIASRQHAPFSDHCRQYTLHICDGARDLQTQVQYTVNRKPLRRKSENGLPELVFNTEHAIVPQLQQIKRIKGRFSCIQIHDGDTAALVSSRKSVNGEVLLSLQCSLWYADLEYTFPITSLRVFNPFAFTDNGSLRSNTGKRRTLQPPQSLSDLRHAGHGGMFDAVADDGCHHRLQLRLEPSDDFLRQVIDLVCQIILPNYFGQAVRLMWWKISKFVGADDDTGDWKAFVTTLFSIAIASAGKTLHHAKIIRSEVSQIGQRANLSTTNAKQRNLNDPWHAMWTCETSSQDSMFWGRQVWNHALAVAGQARQANASAADPSCTPLGAARRNQSDFIPSCILAARKFLETEPNSVSLKLLRSQHELSDTRNGNWDHLASLLVGLHLLYEEQKLDIHSNHTIIPRDAFGAVLAQLGHWVGWDTWSWKRGGYYDLNDSGSMFWDFDDSILCHNDTRPLPLERPPSILDWIERAQISNNNAIFPTLAIIQSNAELSQPPPHSSVEAKEMSKYLNTRYTPRTSALAKYMDHVRQEGSKARLVEAMAWCGITAQMLESLPEGLQSSLREIIIQCQGSPPTTWDDQLLQLVGRKDLELPLMSHHKLRQGAQTLAPNTSVHAPRDLHSICQTSEHPGSLLFASDAYRFAISRLLFSEDRRFVDAARLLEPLQLSVAECPPNPSWTEAEYLEAQKSVMQWVMVRTFALPAGQAMLLFDSKRPLLTEKFPLHGFKTVCLMKPLNNHVSADRSAYTEEKYSWAFFHAGVSSGLAIARDAEGIDTSWILFNKPPDLHNRHAGLLLALGLNGHLKTIAKWLSFKYLTPKHTMTSIGLLLGLSASHIGTMDTLVTRLLSVHVTRMLPPGAAELNLSPLTQTTGLMGIGLLYYNTQHRRMSEVMLSEIEHVELEDDSNPQETLRDEGYRLAAGFALGYINLGMGRDLRGLHDMHLLERLLAVAVSPKPIDVVHILDQASAGAVVAIALIFMKTEDQGVARKIDIPDTTPQFEYVRPDLFLLRTLAKHLILWKSIQATKKWVNRNLPAEFRSLSPLRDIRALRSEHMPFYNVLTALLWSVALKNAGSRDGVVRDFLVKYLDQFIRIAHLPALHYDSRLTRNTVRNCQDLIALAAATVMAGSGDLTVFRRLRLLHGRIGPDVPYGSHLASHLALGALFLGAGSYTFSTSNLAIASLICAFYPIFPASALDNKAHLQAFRHFWVLAADPRCLVVRDVDTHRPITLPVTYTLKPDKSSSSTPTTIETTAPTLLPELSTIATIRTSSPDYWPLTLDFVENPAHLLSFQKTQTIYVRRRPPSDAHGTVFAAALSALNASHSTSASAMVPSALTVQTVGIPAGAAGWEWILRLPALAQIIERENWELVIPSDANSRDHLATELSGVDSRLSIVRAAKGADRDELLALRGFLTWAAHLDERGERARWIGEEVIGLVRTILMERARAAAAAAQQVSHA